jgi:hypothetical protein
MSRRNRYDDSWHQTELQWLEDLIHLWIGEVARFVCSLFTLICLIARASWSVGCFIVRKCN